MMLVRCYIWKFTCLLNSEYNRALWCDASTALYMKHLPSHTYSWRMREKRERDRGICHNPLPLKQNVLSCVITIYMYYYKVARCCVVWGPGLMEYRFSYPTSTLYFYFLIPVRRNPWWTMTVVPRRRHLSRQFRHF